jgi:hypothetical protein
MLTRSDIVHKQMELKFNQHGRPPNPIIEVRGHQQKKFFKGFKFLQNISLYILQACSFVVLQNHQKL